jgi:hypothetical protein
MATLSCISTAAELNLLVKDGSVTFVAIDLEGDDDNIIEAGLAITSCSQPSPYKQSYKCFIRDNKIDCSSIIKPRNPSRREREEKLRFGGEREASGKDFESITQSLLQWFSSFRLLLVTFAAAKELKWMRSLQNSFRHSPPTWTHKR